MAVFPGRQGGRQAAPPGQDAAKGQKGLELIPKDNLLKEDQNNPGSLRTYVTYDTLIETDILLRLL
jgi:hypothetical protein